MNKERVTFAVTKFDFFNQRAPIPSPVLTERDVAFIERKHFAATTARVAPMVKLLDEHLEFPHGGVSIIIGRPRTLKAEAVQDL